MRNIRSEKVQAKIDQLSQLVWWLSDEGFIVEIRNDVVSVRPQR